MATKTKIKKTSLSLDEMLVTRMKKIAFERDMSFSQLMRQLMQKELENSKRIRAIQAEREAAKKESK